MENYDAAMAERVWQRVRGEEPTPYKVLAAAEQNEAAMCLMLSRVLQGKEKTVLRRIFEEEQAHAACLKGMHYFATGEPLSLRTVPPAQDAPEIALRKCYGRKLRTLREYESRISDPEYGAVFEDLAREERRHCREILEIVGKIKR